MHTATEVNDNVGGFAGPARCYRLDPPLGEHEYVTVWVQDAFGAQGPEAVVVAAHDESGAAKNMTRLPGSYVGATPAHSGALWLNGYEIASPEPTSTSEES